MSRTHIKYLEKELSELQIIISNTKQTMVANGTVKIPSTLEKRIKVLCKQLIKLPPKDAKQLGEQLPHLVTLLDAIADDLKKVTISSEPNKKTLLRKASQAYQSTLLYKGTI